MRSPSEVPFPVKAVAYIAAAMLFVVIFHLGGEISHRVGQFSPLTGAVIGGMLTLTSALWPMRRREQVEPWSKSEQLAWVLIGCGILMWGFGESFWRYYISIGQQPFPSSADIGYSSLPPLIFLGLLLQPAPGGSGTRRILLVMDSLIAMGSILAIAWFLLLGSLAQAPGEATLAKFLGLYYPIADTALLSCVVFLLLRGQGRIYQATARRAGLFMIGVGLCFFVFSDFIFNVQNNAGTYVEATWLDLGWPLGLMCIGVAAYLRRFLPATPLAMIEERVERARARSVFGFSRFVPYILLSLLFISLTANVLSAESGQIALRPLLLFATIGVVALVVARQLLTLWENAHLAARQAEALDDLSHANQRIEQQAAQISQHNVELEVGIHHLQQVQAQLANGNLRARATLSGGALLSLAGSLNLMAERLMRLGQMSAYTRRLMRSLAELSVALERAAAGSPVIVPASCGEFVEINRLLVALRSNNVQLVPAATTNTQPGTDPGRGFPPSLSHPPSASGQLQGRATSGLLEHGQHPQGPGSRVGEWRHAVGRSPRSPFPDTTTRRIIDDRSPQ